MYVHAGILVLKVMSLNINKRSYMYMIVHVHKYIVNDV